MLAQLAQGGVIASAAVLEPIADSSDGPAAEAGCIGDIRVPGAGLQHASRLKPRADLGDLAGGHHVSQERTHRRHVRDLSQCLRQLLRRTRLPDAVRLG